MILYANISKQKATAVQKVALMIFFDSSSMNLFRTSQSFQMLPNAVAIMV